MKGLKAIIAEAAAEKRAVGHFNVANLEMLWGVFRAAEKLQVPVIIGVSEGERDAIGLTQIAALVKSLRTEKDFPIYLNADHTGSLDRAKEAVLAGFDAVLVDGTKMSEEDNLKLVKEALAYARAQDPEIVIEGELGFIGQSSQVLTELPAGFNEREITSVEAAQNFVTTTGVDIFAPAVGNVHGMMKDRPDPALNIEQIKAIREAVGVPLVLHGASGNQEAEIKAAIAAGVAVVHVSTELRVAWRDAVKLSLAENLDEVAPYKLMKPATLAVEKVVDKKLRLFNNLL
jgi:fructose-bisphosphate aldolase class II